MASIARAWLGVSLHTASPHGFLSLAVSESLTPYLVAGLLPSEHARGPRWEPQALLGPSLEIYPPDPK